MALAAQGFNRARPSGRVDTRHFRRLIDQLGAVQLDSVNVFTRTHYMPFFSRLGPYDRNRLDAYAAGGGEIFEYWGHEASWLPLDTQPLFRWRMADTRRWGRVSRVLEENPGYVEAVHEHVLEAGPLSVSDLEDPGARTGPWWGYGKGKIALEWLFSKGKITAFRSPEFRRLYIGLEKYLPRPILDHPTPARDEAQKALLVRAARAHGVGTAQDLADYYRIRPPEARPLLELLADEGRLRRVEVPGWKPPVYAHPEATIPRSISGRALLSPFDSLIWARERTERLFDFRYRIEIYVPEPKRVHGYYVLPFLLDGDLVARVDLKSERKAGFLHVKGAYAEPDVDKARVARELAAELRDVAAWLGLQGVQLGRRGNLIRDLRKAS